MSFRHQVVERLSKLNALSYEKPTGDFLGAPILEGSETGDGSDALLQWTPPESEVTIYGYEIRVDGNIHDSIGNETTYTYKDMTFEQQYDFQVRAVGPAGLKSPFSNIVTLEGGGAPDLIPTVYKTFKNGGSIIWQDISDNTFYNIEGYNIYYSIGDHTEEIDDSGSLEKVNEYQYDPTDVKFTHTFLPEVEEETVFTMGVSYIYDGGQESEIYTNLGTIIPISFFYVVSSSNNPPVPVLKHDGQTETASIPIIVKEGTLIHMLNLRGPGAWSFYRSWVSVYFNGTWETYFILDIGGDSNPYTYENDEGCDDEDFQLIDKGDLNHLGDAIGEDFYVACGWDKSFDWTVSGACSRSDDMRSVWELIIEAPNENVVEENIEEFNNRSRTDASITKKTIETKMLITSRVEDSEGIEDMSSIIFELEANYPGLPYNNLYIKDENEDNYGDPFNSTPIEDWVVGSDYFVETLSPGTYHARASYIRPNESTEAIRDNGGILYTNVVAFTIE